MNSARCVRAAAQSSARIHDATSRRIHKAVRAAVLPRASNDDGSRGCISIVLWPPGDDVGGRGGSRYGDLERNSGDEGEDDDDVLEHLGWFMR